MNRQFPFTCKKCGHTSAVFHSICSGCGRPFIRDYIDTRIHPRDPDPAGVCTSRFWARIFLIIALVIILSGLLISSGILG